MSLRAFAVLVLAAPLAGCTLTLHRDERELAEFDPQGAARPALQLEVVERRGWVGHAGLWIGPGKEERVSGSALERLRARWESSGAFERVDSDEHRGPGQPAELELRLRQVRDEVARSPEGPMVLYFAPVVVPLLFVSGTHRDVLLVWDARFERDGELLAEITRAERLRGCEEIPRQPRPSRMRRGKARRRRVSAAILGGGATTPRRILLRSEAAGDFFTTPQRPPPLALPAVRLDALRRRRAARGRGGSGAIDPDRGQAPRAPVSADAQASRGTTRALCLDVVATKRTLAGGFSGARPGFGVISARRSLPGGR